MLLLSVHPVSYTQLDVYKRQLRGLYLHYCYKLGILPKGRKQDYAKLHYLLKDNLMKMEMIAKETRLLCRCHIDTAEQLLSYQASLTTEMAEPVSYTHLDVYKRQRLNMQA